MYIIYMDFLNKSKDFVNGDSPISKIVKALVIVVVVMFLINVAKKVYMGYDKWVKGSPWILKGTKDLKKNAYLKSSKKDNYNLKSNE